MSFLKNKKVGDVQFKKLDIGAAIVRLLNAEETNSFQQYNGTPKEADKPWRDATPQVAITIVSAEPGKTGGMTHRFNLLGYIRYDELSDEQKLEKNKAKELVYENLDGYACTVSEDGEMVRIVDDAKSAICDNILNQFAHAIGMSKDEEFIDEDGKLFANAIAEQTKFIVTVVNKPYHGKDLLRLGSSFKAYKEVAAVNAGFDE